MLDILSCHRDPMTLDGPWMNASKMREERHLRSHRKRHISRGGGVRHFDSLRKGGIMGDE